MEFFAKKGKVIARKSPRVRRGETFRVLISPLLMLGLPHKNVQYALD
ncbi:MAG TPA: hypothetical protein VL327_05935 [Pyrinomonadaceae bacterium]|nr:hypothetical protein [Pyrinomonadaceae bacterium]